MRLGGGVMEGVKGGGQTRVGRTTRVPIMHMNPEIVPLLKGTKEFAMKTYDTPPYDFPSPMQTRCAGRLSSTGRSFLEFLVFIRPFHTKSNPVGFHCVWGLDVVVGFH